MEVFTPSFMPVTRASQGRVVETQTAEAKATEASQVVASDSWTPFDVANPVELLYTVSGQFREGSLKLHAWQKEELLFLSSPHYTRENPLQHQLIAANGSGKDSFVIGPFAVWHALAKRRSKCFITSSSAAQLTTQTEPVISSLCEGWNRLVPGTFNVRQRHITCNPTGSEIILRVTDDPGRLEGEHPFYEFADAEFCLIANEAKTVDDAMFEALRRCNGYNRWIEVSTPGSTSGHLYNTYRRSTRWPAPYIPGQTVWYSRKVSAYECPHLSRTVIEDLKREKGEHSAYFRSSILAEFSEIDTNVIITSSMVEKGQDMARSHIKLPMAAGFDLSCGASSSDELYGYLVEGNRILDSVSVQGAKDAVDAVAKVCAVLAKWKEAGLDMGRCGCDGGGVGDPMVAMIRSNGYAVANVKNQTAAYHKAQYGNLGAELYFNLQRIMEEGFINLDPKEHQVLIDQLRSRLHRKGAMDKLYLEKKEDMRRRGLRSPDRADAFVLAMRLYRISDFMDDTKPMAAQPINPFDPVAYEFGMFDSRRKQQSCKPCFGSTTAVLAAQQRTNLCRGL